MNYLVFISPQALAEVEEAYWWIHARSPAGAARWYKALMRKVHSLESKPQRCSVAPEADAFPMEIRQLLHGKRSGVYRILFTIENERVHILHIRHAARGFITPDSSDESEP